MPVQPCVNRVNDCLPCNDSPILNLTAEGTDTPLYLGIYAAKNTPDIGEEIDTFGAQGCLGWCWSEESQEDADECAEAQAVLCANPLWIPNIATMATCACDVGTFTYILPAGSLYAPTSESAQAFAASVAQLRAPKKRFCLDSAHFYACYNEAMSETLSVDGGIPPFTFTVVSGAFPTGISLTDAGVLSGVPTVAGDFDVVIRVTDSGANGNFLEAPITVSVIQLMGSMTVGMCFPPPLSVMEGETDPPEGLTFEVVGDLPTGWDLPPSGLFEGSSHALGSWIFDIYVVYPD